jgi:hypothetical protein
MLFRRSIVGVAALAALLAACSSAPLPEAVSPDPADPAADRRCAIGRCCRHRRARPRGPSRGASERRGRAPPDGRRDRALGVAIATLVGCWPRDAVHRGWRHGAGYGQHPPKSADAVASAEDRRARERVAALLSEPLSEDAAVQIALLNNRGLQAAYNELGISEAEYVQASLPPNPAITLSRKFGTGSFVEFGFQLVGNLLAMATLPRRTEIARREFEEARHRAVATTLSFSVDARRAYIRAVAAQRLRCSSRPADSRCTAG